MRENNDIATELGILWNHNCCMWIGNVRTTIYSHL